MVIIGRLALSGRMCRKCRLAVWATFYDFTSPYISTRRTSTVPTRGATMDDEDDDHRRIIILDHHKIAVREGCIL